VFGGAWGEPIPRQEVGKVSEEKRSPRHSDNGKRGDGNRLKGKRAASRLSVTGRGSAERRGVRHSQDKKEKKRIQANGLCVVD